MAQAVYALKAAFEKAVATKSSAWPSDAELAAAFRGLTFPTPTSPITLREDGQGLANMLVGRQRSDPKYPFPILSDMVLFPGAMVTTPVGKKSFDWLKTLEPEILSRVPQPIIPKG